jgi:hypothetical protein
LRRSGHIIDVSGLIDQQLPSGTAAEGPDRYGLFAPVATIREWTTSRRHRSASMP